MRADDDLDHFFTCPTIANMHVQAEAKLHSLLNDMGIALPILPNPVLWEINQFLHHQHVKRLVESKHISQRHLTLLARKYTEKVFPSQPSPIDFSAYLKNLLDHYKTNSNDISVPYSLLEILTQELSLEVEGYSDPLHLTDILPRYLSLDPDHA